MTRPLPDEKLTEAWTSIEEAIQRGLSEDGTNRDEHPLNNVINVTTGSDELSTYVEYRREPPIDPSSGMRVHKIKPTLEEVYELRFTTSVSRADGFDADDKLRDLPTLEEWGQTIREEERDWVLRKLIDRCADGKMLTPDEQIFRDHSAVRVIPIHGTNADHVATWPITAAVTIAKPVPGPDVELAVIVIPIGQGPSVIRIEDVALWHRVSEESISVEATARYQLIGFGQSETRHGKRFKAIEPPPESEPPESEPPATGTNN